jgi:hypothetical protein
MNLYTYGASSWATYGSFAHPHLYVAGIDTAVETEEPTVPPAPVETPYDRFKAKMARLSAASAAQLADPGPPAPERSPDYTHTITAWRGWDVRDGMLEALGSSSRWEPRRALKANCISCGGHAAPYLNCRCGYWSFKTQELLAQAMDKYDDTVKVIGQVEIWGRVIECENGFRSEYAYPKELWLLDEGLESLSWRYGVPVRRLS